MNNIFDQLKDITEVKSNKLLDDFDTLQNFSPYMICRWLSMQGEHTSHLINETSNRLYRGIGSKEQWYQLLQVLIPKQKYKYANYIKKDKETIKNNQKDKIKQIANFYEISQREVEFLIENNLLTEQKIKEITL